MSNANPPSTTNAPDEHDSRNARYGLKLFAVYLVLYGGFVLLSAFSQSVREATMWGISLPALLGIALILAAFALALVYARGCSDAQPTTEEEQSS